LKIRLTLVSCLGIAALSAAQEPSRTLTLKQAMEEALAKNPAVGRAHAEFAAAEALKKGGLSAVLPHLTATGNYTRNSTQIAFETSSSNFLILPRNDWNTKITLTQPIFAGLRDQRALHQLRVGIEQAREQTRGAEDQILLKVAADYLEVVQEDALVDIELKNLDLAQKRRKQAQDLFEAGEATRVDSLRALADVKAAERRLAGARRDRDVAVGQLRVDLAAEGDLRVEDPGTVGVNLPPEADLLPQALAARPEVAQAEGAVSVAELEVSKQKGAYFPIVSAEAAYIRQRTAFPTDHYGYARLNLTVPIFDSGETGAHVAVAVERLKQARLALEDLKRSVREDVHKALLDLETARKSLALAQEQLAASEAQYEQSFELYRSQEATSLDVQTAEVSLADARRAALSSRLEATLGELKVWYAIGSLKAAVFKEVHP